jgi:hypothetical protein
MDTLKASKLMGTDAYITTSNQTEQSKTALILLDAGFNFSRFYTPGHQATFPIIAIKANGEFCNESEMVVLDRVIHDDSIPVIAADAFITANPRTVCQQ